MGRMQLSPAVPNAPIAENNPFLNIAKCGGSWTLTDNGASVSGASVWSGGYLDANGELSLASKPNVTNAQFLVNEQSAAGIWKAGYTNAGKVFYVEWDGTATCSRSGFSGSSAISTINSNKVQITFGSSGEGNASLSFAISNVNDPPRNIRMYETQFESNVAAGEIFRPDWLAIVSKFPRLRLLDWIHTNSSNITDYSHIADESYFRWGKPYTSGGSFGTKGAIPLSVIIRLAEDTGADIQVTLPHQATDDCVTSIIEYFEANFPSSQQIIFEWTNEHWNAGFQQNGYCLTQGNAIWSGDGERGSKYCGYRSAQVMKIAKDTFGSNSGASRWKGVLATQTANSAVSSATIVGVNYWRANVLSPSNSIALNELFSELQVTGYFATNWGTGAPNRPSGSPAVTKGATPTVTHATNHGFTTGQEIKFNVFSGMTELNGQFATVTVVNSTQYTIDIDTTSYSDWINSDRNYVSQAEIFRLMDASTQANIDDATTYPDKYALFDSVVNNAMQDGSASWTGGSITLPYSVDNLENVRWPAHKTIADSNGLSLTQYEGTSHLIGDAYLAGFGGQSQLTEFLTRTAHTAGRAAVTLSAFQAFLRVGGKLPAMFVDMGYPGPNNTWGGIRFFPGDENNDLWQAAVTFNKNKKTVTVTT